MVRMAGTSGQAIGMEGSGLIPGQITDVFNATVYWIVQNAFINHSQFWCVLMIDPYINRPPLIFQ